MKGKPGPRVVDPAMAKKNTAALAKARQKKIARKENKRKEKRREVRHEAGAAAATQRAAEVAIENANHLWFDAEDAVAFLNDPAEDASADDLHGALEDLAFDLEESLVFVRAAAGSENPNIEEALRELGFVFRPVDHVRMTEALVEHAELLGRQELTISATSILARWTLLVRADPALQVEVADSLTYLAASGEDRVTLTTERLRSGRSALPPADSPD